MNTYSANGEAIIDASGKAWPVNVWHPLPMPVGIEDSMQIMYADSEKQQWVPSPNSTHWLTSVPTPPLPFQKAKTQEEKDDAAFDAFMSSNPLCAAYQIWWTALDYARRKETL